MALTTVPASLSSTAITLTTAAQPNITSVGTLTGLTVSGNIAGTLTTAAQTNITSVGTLTSLTVSGALNGTLSTAAQPNITSLGTLTSLTVSGRVQPNEHIIFGSTTGYLQFPGASSRAWAMASQGGTAAPGTNSATFGIHHWSGSAWSNPINITASGKLCIGTDNPDRDLHIKGSGTDVGIQIEKTGSHELRVAVDSTGPYLYAEGTAPLRFYQNNAEIIRITGGELKIGTGSYTNSQYYASDVVIHAANEGGLTIANSANNHASYIMFADGVSSGSEQYAGYIEYNHSADRMRVKSNGTFQIYATAFGQDAFLVRSNGNISLHGPSNDDIGSNTGIVFTANNQIRVGGNDGTNMYTGYQLMLDRMNTPGDGPQIVLSRNGYFKAAIGGIQNGSGNATSSEGALTFYTATSSAFNERMKLLHNNGLQVTMGTQVGWKFRAYAYDSDSYFGVYDDNNHSANIKIDRSDGLTVFYVMGHTGNYHFYGSDTSDRDLKENIVSIPDGSLNLVKQLKPCTFNFHAEGYGKDTRTGFIAQEVAEVFTTDNHVATGTDGNKDMGVDHMGIIAHLTKAIQELSAEVEALKAKVGE